MKHKLLFTLILLALTTVLKAQTDQTVQPRKTAEQRTDAEVAQMTADLGLTPDQQSKIYDIILLREKKRDAGRLTDDDKKAYKKQIHEVLTPEQQKKKQELKKQKEQSEDHHKKDKKKKATQEQPVTN